MQRKAPGSIPHEKTDFRIAEKIKIILEVQTTSAQQEILHENDEGTTWFGVVREDIELPMFRDYGRYAAIMADTLHSSFPHSFDGTVGARDHRFPSLVSFVGQTGLRATVESKACVLTLNCRRRKEHCHQACHRSHEPNR